MKPLALIPQLALTCCFLAILSGCAHYAIVMALFNRDFSFHM